MGGDIALGRRAAMKLPATGLAIAAGLHFVPSVATIPALHQRFLPRLSGNAPGPHVALTFDDGPDPASTPSFLDALAALDVRATFFVLGSQLAAHPELGRRIVDAGHEVAVHGWLHRAHLLRVPWQVPADVVRTVECIERACGTTPRFWRPPNGVISGAGLYAARRHSLTPVLWTADGRDWDATATPTSIQDRIARQLRAGGVVLLHDSDITSVPDSWRNALGALPGIVEHCHAAGWSVGPLRDHVSPTRLPA
jgi:peptidoglycan/xylan/chitin deacetylase (PgdA/CDA1 family)